MTPAKVSNATKQILAGEQGPQGKTGPQGPRCARGAQGPTGATGKSGAQGPKGEAGAAATALWATVEGNNKPNPTFIAKSPAAVSVERIGEDPGVYTVNFDRNVSACAYSVSTVDTLEMVSVDTALFTEGKPNGVAIQVNRWKGAEEPPLDDTEFTISVFC